MQDTIPAVELMVETDNKKVIFTLVENRSLTGLSKEMTKDSFVNMLIDSGVLSEGDTINKTN